MVRPTVIAGNWKLNPPRVDGERLFADVCNGLPSDSDRALRVVVFPPAPYLGAFSATGDGRVALGAQDLTPRPWGAFTGAVNGALLRSFGVDYVLVGHSERRQLFGETDAQTGEKMAAALADGLLPVLCVGETLAERDGGETFEVLQRQLERGLAGGVEGEFAVAYEPVWAIGTGRTATVEIASEAHRFLRARLGSLRSAALSDATPILYGGSVKPENAAELLGDEEIDGCLVGGASLSAAGFLEIVAAGAVRSRRRASGAGA